MGMADDLRDTGKRDDQRISVNQAQEITYWTRILHCSEEQLRKAVDAVGPMANDVRNWIKKSKSKIAKK
jgi:hypothetical protein